VLTSPSPAERCEGRALDPYATVATAGDLDDIRRRVARVVACEGVCVQSGKEDMTEASLYERLGGAFAIAAVVDHFSDAVVRNPIAGQGSKDPELDEWRTNDLDRLPGLKFMRTLWGCEVAGGPQV
jgi:hemoglobin